jgi:hypothetical protein
MTTVNYLPSSPYANTDQVNVYLEYLDFWNGPYILPQSTDDVYTVQPKYDKRPDLLSYDHYGSTGWWWIFAARNPDKIKDPIYDLKAGMTIYLPNKANLPRLKT